jgi:hypothetical protein
MVAARVVASTKRSVRAEIVIDAVGPDAAYAAVSDVGRMSEWSPEGRAIRPPAHQLGVGDTFTGGNRRGRRRWATNCVVVHAERPTRFGFDVSWAGIDSARWEYEFAGFGDGVLVRETWTDHRRGLRGFVVKAVGFLASGVWNRSRHNAETMCQTLDGLASALTPTTH